MKLQLLVIELKKFNLIKWKLFTKFIGKLLTAIKDKEAIKKHINLNI